MLIGKIQYWMASSIWVRQLPYDDKKRLYVLGSYDGSTDGSVVFSDDSGRVGCDLANTNLLAKYLDMRHASHLQYVDV